MTKNCDFQCLDGHYCVTESDRCNGVPDCIDHSDETEECDHKRKSFELLFLLFTEPLIFFNYFKNLKPKKGPSYHDRS